jgi:hypothetical protein
MLGTGLFEIAISKPPKGQHCGSLDQRNLLSGHHCKKKAFFVVKLGFAAVEFNVVIPRLTPPAPQVKNLTLTLKVTFPELFPAARVVNVRDEQKTGSRMRTNPSLVAPFHIRAPHASRQFPAERIF